MSFVSGVFRIAAICCIAPAGLLWAAKKPLTIDAIVEAHHDLGEPVVWAPDGRRFVHQNENRVYLYDVPSRSDKELFSLDALQKLAVEPPPAAVFGWQNRRVREEPVQWSPSGQELLLAVKGDLFLWRFSTGKAEQLTATAETEADPRISPDGKRVAFRRGHDLYSLEIATKGITQLTRDRSATLLNGELDWVYPEELDLGTAYWWSPDSRRIAYMQFDVANEFVYPQTQLTALRAQYEPERYPQAGTPNPVVRVGVVPVEGAEPQTVWLDLGKASECLIARVDWLRDSGSVAVQRANRIQNRLDLLVADAATGRSRTILTETDKYWINISDAYRFLSESDQFLWSSERDGHRHLSLYSVDGRERARLTQGDWEVESIAGVDQAHSLVYYVSNEGNPLENQLWRVGLDGGNKTRLSANNGVRTISMSPVADYYTEFFSNVTTPPATTIHAADGKQIAVLREYDRGVPDKYQLLPAEFVQLKAADGTTLYARLIRPAGFRQDRKYPAIVMVYGGPGVQSVRNVWSGATWERVMAQRGFVIWELDNRGTAGRGHAFETPLFRRFGKTELEDQQTGVRYLLAMGFVDPARIGVTGWSYGGYMTLNCLLNAPELFHAGFAGAPVTDWHNYDTIYTERYLGLPSENEAGYREGSAVTWADKLKNPLLIVHNMEDDNVLFQNTLQMAAALEAAGKQFSIIPYTEKTHGLYGPTRRHLYETMTEFFEKELTAADASATK
ncbi:MAG: DPP IV N-terminal domain-containing protein [Bryobacteraceae bacterium]